MDLAPFIVPTGIIAFVLFLVSMVNGITAHGLPRFHAVTAYACGAIVILHSAAAMASGIYEPLGMAATAGMLLTIASGTFKWARVHIPLAAVTLVFSVLHVALILYFS